MSGYGGIGSRTLRPSRNPATAASTASTANTIAAGSERPRTGSNLKVHGSVCWPGDGTSTCVWMVTGVFGSSAPVFTVTVCAVDGGVAPAGAVDADRALRLPRGAGEGDGQRCSW